MSKETKKNKESAGDDKKSVKDIKAERDKKLNDLVNLIRKDLGQGAVFHGDAPVQDVQTISTGSTTLDMCTGIGGVPLGRIIEIYGPESSGKTTLTLHMIAEAQKAGMKCGFIDAEHALDPGYARKIGVDVDDLLISQPDHGEQAMEIARMMAGSGAVNVIVVDSVAALVPKVELEGEFDKSNMGLQARMMSKGLRVLTGEVSKNNVLIIFINQIRMKIGVMYGSPETTTGGEALKYYASMRMKIRSGEKFKDGDQIVGGTIIVKMIKNKLAAPFTECEVPVVYGQGIDKVGDLYTVAKEWGILDVRGAHHYLDGEKFASKKEEAVDALRKDKKLFDKVNKLVREEHKKRAKNGNAPQAAASEEDRIEAEEITPSEE